LKVRLKNQWIEINTDDPIVAFDRAHMFLTIIKVFPHYRYWGTPDEVLDEFTRMCKQIEKEREQK